MTARGPHGRALERLAEDGAAREIAHEYPPRVAPARLREPCAANLAVLTSLDI